MPLVATGTQKLIDLDLQWCGKRGKRFSVSLDEGAHVDARGARRRDVLERVVVRAGVQPCLPAAQAPVPRENVGLHQFQCIAEMRRGIHVRNRGSDIGTDHDCSPLSGLPTS
jgi:hypothetical protein